MSKQVGILGLGMCVPNKVLTNHDLEKMVDTSDEWIVTRTGIKERRIVETGQATSDMSVKAAKEALAEANMQPEDLELIILATITPDTLLPSASCQVQDKLGAKNAACFDLAAACAGFAYAATVAKSLIESGAYKNALIVGAETLSPFTDWEDRSTCILFGDGAGAAILGESDRGRILATSLGSNGTMGDLLKVPAGGSKLPCSYETIDRRQHYIKMEGREVFKVAVEVMADSAREVVKKGGLKIEDVDYLIPHQANLRIIKATRERLGIPEERVHVNLNRYGNMSSASTPIALYEAKKQGKIKQGDYIVMVAFGGGLAWGSLLLKW
jgi:3-oxoacyl-[acyl-carrier-protein] synthase-3